MNENMFHAILIVMMMIVLAVFGSLMLAGIMAVALVLYAIAAAVGNMVIDHHATKARAAQVASTAYLHTHINDNRQALPFSAWADSKWDAAVYEQYINSVHPETLDN